MRGRRIVLGFVLAALGLIALVVIGGAFGQGKRPNSSPGVGAARVRVPIAHDVSPPLRSMPLIKPRRHTKQLPEFKRELKRSAPAAGGASTTAQVQSSQPTKRLPAPVASFDGVSNVDSVAPPDPNGDVGPNNYVQWVNLSFQIFNKSGTSLYGPAAGNTLWQGLSGACASENSGDPIVLYDQAADRWLLSQFAFSFDADGFPFGPYYQCIAISKTGDPTGQYYRYVFLSSSNELNDYPKFGVWRDGYYMAVNQFDENLGFEFSGVQIVAFERDKMLNGQTAHGIVFEPDFDPFDPFALASMLPADIDGATLPGSGAPEVFAQLDDNNLYSTVDQLQLWNFHTDWTTPANSTFTQAQALPTASFDGNLCFLSDCVPQKNTRERLDPLSDRLMFRLAYRNFGDHEALVTNHTADVGSDRAGVRWYELRRTASTWSIFQQNTFAPSGDSRWMGSAAMNGEGDIAVGYSISSGSRFPSIRVAGRLNGDPLGQLTRGETTIKDGQNSQTTFGRWGDYSAMNVDPSDDCTFWYTNEYYQPSNPTGFDWKTRIGAVSFCRARITSFTPTHGGPGASVVITGSGFTGTTSVKFNGLSASSFHVDSPTQITAVVPSGVTSGKITVTNGVSTGTSADDFLAGPTVGTFAPLSGPVGTTVTVNGLNFLGTADVKFNGVSAGTFSVLTNTKLTAVVPTGATQGPITVMTPAGTSSSPAAFKVTPKITLVSPAFSQVGDEVTITGMTFTGATSVRFGTVIDPGFVVSVDGTEITAHVPATAVTGKISVTTPAGTALSPLNFGVRPTIDPLGVTHGTTGTILMLTGKTFGGTSSVKFTGAGGLGTVSAGYSVPSSTSLKVTVPSAALTGPIRVTNSGGATDSESFVVDPKITSTSPAAAPVQTLVSINGSGFDGTSVVRFNGTTAAPGNTIAVTPIVFSANLLRAEVPAGATSGPVTVETDSSSVVATKTGFKVTPKITGWDTPVLAGDTVDVDGTNLDEVVASGFKLGSLIVPFSPDSPTHGTFVVPTNAVSGKLSIKTLAGTYTTPTNLGVRPTIDFVNPGNSRTGLPVNLTGKTFTGTNSVKFTGLNGTFVSAGFSVLAPNSLRVNVPTGAISGPIRVQNAGGTTDSTPVVIDPKVASVSPSAAPVGTTVTIGGSGFDNSTTVNFNGTPAHPGGVRAEAPTILSSTSLRVTVPAGATTGAISVDTSSSSVPASWSKPFKVTPKILGFTTPAQVGDTVDVTGTNLNDPGATLKLGSVAVSILPDTSTHVQFVVPANGVTGKLSFATVNGSYTTSGNLGVRPTIDSVSGTAVAGSSLTLAGKTFGGTSSVKFTGLNGTLVSAGFTVPNSTSLRTTVPSTAISGPIRVTNAGGATDSAHVTVTPKVTSFSPASGRTGILVTINGAGFDSGTEVEIGGKEAAVMPVTSATQVKATVPDGAAPGHKIEVTTDSGGASAESAGTFNVTLSVTGFTPTTGPVATPVEINGVGFTGTTEVKFGSQPASPFLVVDSSHITTTVPTGATTGRISVTTPAGTVQSADDFVVTASGDAPAEDSPQFEAARA